MTSPVLQIDRVSKRFGDFVAVDDVSLNLQAGEFFTLLGPSGCGKTTLLRILSGFETPDTGSIVLDGVDVTAAPPYRRNVNQVFQSYALFPHLSVRRNIEFGLKMKRLSWADRSRKVDDALSLVALTGLGDRKPAQLSGGQRQRVALARALVCEPRVLLLDEPLAALDAKLRRTMQVELKRLQARVGITFVFVTHDQEEALTLSDRIGVMNGGRLQQVGTAAEVYHRPATGFVASFLGHANLHAGVVDATTNVIVLNDGTRLSTASSPVQSGDVSISVRPEHIQIFAECPSGPNVFECTIVERLFKGASDQLTLKSSGGQIWTATRFNGAGESAAVTSGKALYARVRPEDVVVIAERPAEPV